MARAACRAVVPAFGAPMIRKSGRGMGPPSHERAPAHILGRSEPGENYPDQFSRVWDARFPVNATVTDATRVCRLVPVTWPDAPRPRCAGGARPPVCPPGTESHIRP